MRLLTVVALLLALAAPATAAPFGKPRTIGTTSLAYEYDHLFSAPGPHGGVAFFAAAEKQIDLKITQRLFIGRVEGTGRAHRLTATPFKTAAPARSYDGGPPEAYLAVGPQWRMLTTEKRASSRYQDPDVFAVRIGIDGRRLGEQLVGASRDTNGWLNTDTRGDAALAVGDRVKIARRAGRFVRAPAALDVHEAIPFPAGDGSLYDVRAPGDGSLAVAYSRSGRRWGKPQTFFKPTPGGGIDYAGLVTSSGGDALLAYGFGNGYSDTSLIVRWSHRGGSFSKPIELQPHADPYTQSLEAVPGGGFAVRWVGVDGRLHLARASRRGKAFRQVNWPIPKNAGLRTMIPIAGGRALLAWSIADPEFVKPARLEAAWVSAHGKIGRAQTVAVSRRLDGFGLHALGARRVALAWTVAGKKVKRVRVAVTRR